MAKAKLKKIKTAKKTLPKKVKKIASKAQTEALAVGFHKRSFYLLFRKFSADKNELRITSGKAGTKFDGPSYKVEIVGQKKEKENIADCSDFRFSSDGDVFVLTYLKHSQSGAVLTLAKSKDGKKWKVDGAISKIKTAGVVALDKEKSENIYFGDHILKVARKSKAGWNIVEPARVPHWHFFEGSPFEVVGATEFGENTAVFYSAECVADILTDVSLRDEKIGEEILLKIGVAIFSGSEPSRLLWQTELPIVEVPITEFGKVKILGLAPFVGGTKLKSEKTFRIYISSGAGELGFVEIPEEALTDHRERKQILLKKWENNPILAPTSLDFERDGAFNPTALRLDGRVHLLYRATGGDGMSSIGYASSSDGLNIDERLKKPIYTPRFWFEKTDGEKSEKDETLFSSGGGWGGCEDPKVTQIGDRIYMTYVAHTGGWPTRTVLTSISVDDFLAKRWRWSKPQLMSPPGVGSKSVVLFPEKINDKYYIFHRRWPSIKLDAVDNLEFGEGKQWLSGHHSIRPRKSFWDSLKMSVGGTPIKTKDGWLVIYNAVDRLDGGKYKIGAMLLDLRNPEKVLARSRRPILSPEEFYENDGKSGVAYPGGAVDMDGMLHVYYGGADKVCCVAQIPTEELLWHLKKDAVLPKLKNLK